jgi:hypothetical protein
LIPAQTLCRSGEINRSMAGANHVPNSVGCVPFPPANETAGPIGPAVAVAGAGFERPQEITGNVPDSVASGAESGARLAPDAIIDPVLAEVVHAWPTLPNAIQSGILAMICTAP